MLQIWTTTVTDFDFHRYKFGQHRYKFGLLIKYKS